MEGQRSVLLDEGFLFGLGAFETIAVRGGRPVFLDRHLRRLEGTLAFLGISGEVRAEEVSACLGSAGLTEGALKIAVSEKNRLFLPRENPYRETDYERGFTVDFAKGRRNEYSPFTYHKTMNYGDCIWEKRQAAARALNEAVFLNSRGEICEGCVSNIFFVRAGRLFTPELSCGLLPGIVRGYLLECYGAVEGRITAEEIAQFEECFLTNSLMGVMPVVRFGDHIFRKRETAEKLRKALLQKI